MEDAHTQCWRLMGVNIYNKFETLERSTYRLQIDHVLNY